MLALLRFRRCLNIISSFTLSAAHGAPQSRRRVFLICYLDPRCAGKVLPIFGNDPKALIQLIGGPQGYRVYDPEGVALHPSLRGWRHGR